jgi:hypothetical protein
MRRGGLALGLLAVLGAALCAAYLLTHAPDTPSPRLETAAKVSRLRPPGVPPPRVAIVPTHASTLRAAEDEAAHEVEIPVLLRDTEGPREAVRQAIEDHGPEIRECEEAWQRQNPDLAGRMIVRFDITDDDAGQGEVTHVELLEGGVGQLFVEGCVLNVFQGMRFPAPPDGEVSVVYPVQFDAVDDGGR